MVDKGLETTRKGHLAKLGSGLGCGRGEACLQGGVSSSAMWTQEDPVQHGPGEVWGAHRASKGSGFQDLDLSNRKPSLQAPVRRPQACLPQGPGSLTPHRAGYMAIPQPHQGGPAEPR